MSMNQLAGTQLSFTGSDFDFQTVQESDGGSGPPSAIGRGSVAT